MNIWLGGVSGFFAEKQAFFLSFVNILFSLQTFVKKLSYNTTQVYPTSFNLRSWGEEILELLQSLVA
jgi:hypothetical protein